MTLSTNENAQVTHMVCWGEGVWISYRSMAALQLWHTISKDQLQDINIKQAINGIVAGKGKPTPSVLQLADQTCLLLLLYQQQGSRVITCYDH